MTTKARAPVMSANLGAKHLTKRNKPPTLQCPRSERAVGGPKGVFEGVIRAAQEQSCQE